MTTIVKVGKAIAIDSRLTQNGTILSNSCEKFVDDETHVYLFTGTICNMEFIVDAVKSDLVRQAGLEKYLINTTCIRLDKKTGVTEEYTTHKETGVFQYYEIKDDVYAWGSGRNYAYGALGMIEITDTNYFQVERCEAAVESASKYDIYTGGNVNSWVAF